MNDNELKANSNKQKAGLSQLIQVLCIPNNEVKPINRNNVIHYFAKKQLAGFALHLYEKNYSIPDRLKPNDIQFSGNNGIELIVKGFKKKDFERFKEINALANLMGLEGIYGHFSLNDKEDVLFPIEMRSVQVSSDNTLSVKLEEKNLSEWWGLKVSSQQGPEIEDAVDLVNSMLDNNGVQDPLWELYFSEPMGWKIMVEKDDSDRVWEPGEPGVDRLGAYRHTCEKKDKNYPFACNSKIVLYTKAISGFKKELEKNHSGEYKLSNIYAYVLAHELFHAYQDFHMGMDAFDPKTLNKKPDDQNLKHIETYAEYFALYYVLNCLRDEALFNALCEDHRNSQKGTTASMLESYTDAIKAFGEIENKDSSTEFLKSLKLWREHWANKF